MKWLWRSSITKTLLGSFLAVLIPLTIISLSVNYISMRVVKQEVSNSYMNSVTLLSKQLDGSLKKFENISNILIVDQDLNNMDQFPDGTNILWDYAGLLRNLQLFSIADDLKSNITVYLKNKNKVFSSGYGIDPITEWDEKNIFQTDVDSHNRWLFRESSRRDGGEVLSFVRNTKFDNLTVSVDIYIDQIKRLLENLQNQVEGRAFLLDSKGHVISVSDTYNDAINNIVEMIKNYDNTTGQFTYRQNRVVFSKSDSTGLILGMYFPEKQIMASILRIRSWIIMVLFTSIGLIIIFTLLTYNNLLLPMHKLIAGMREVKNGNLKIRIPEKHNDEFGFMFTQFNNMVSQIDTLINEVYMERLKQQQAQLKFLQSQINPHFLYNCLNFIYQMAMAENTDGAAKMALFLGKYFRFATKSNKDLVTIKEELDSVDAYINIQQMRYPGKINFHLEVPDNLTDITIPRLIIQPIVENAFVHGLEPANGSGNIWIKACCEQEAVKIVIEDDGVGIKPEELDVINKTLDEINQKNRGYGLNNTHWRLKLRFGEDAGINVEQRWPKGTRVILKIPHTNIREEERNV